MTTSEAWPRAEAALENAILAGAFDVPDLDEAEARAEDMLRPLEQFDVMFRGAPAPAPNYNRVVEYGMRLRRKRSSEHVIWRRLDR